MLKHRNKNIFTAIDLFSGTDGFTVGSKRAGFEVVAVVEVDKEIKKKQENLSPIA